MNRNEVEIGCILWLAIIFYEKMYVSHGVIIVWVTGSSFGAMVGHSWKNFRHHSLDRTQIVEKDLCCRHLRKEFDIAAARY